MKKKEKPLPPLVPAFSSPTPFSLAFCLRDPLSQQLGFHSFQLTYPFFPTFSLDATGTPTKGAAIIEFTNDGTSVTTQLRDTVSIG